ncbi:MAG: S46 family peptidase [Bacteroidetes bacterium]|nr:S46 family peptidase [Bacteroidota bacterium]
MLRSLLESLKSVLVLLIFISACSPPIQVATVKGKLEKLPSESPKRDSSTEGTVSEVIPPRYPIVETGEFDDGKMWTFDRVPAEYLKSTYGIPADSAWFNKARLGALRFSTSCSASLVSSRGLVMTNHHCARESIIDVQKKGENLLDDGYYASHDSLERKVKDLYVEQLISIEDVSEEVLKAAEKVPGAGPKAEARRKRAEAIENRTNNKLKIADSTMTAQVVELYSGGKYALYTYRKFTDVRLVFAPELKIGYFGGDTDNFTYPRHTFDLSFFRIWSGDSVGVTPEYFTWNTTGVKEGDPVFVVGNPGSTSRLHTVDQLEYQRDIELPGLLEVLDDRTAVLAEFLSSVAADADSFDVRNDLMGARNTQKALEGQYKGLMDGEVLSRTYSAELQLEKEIGASDSLSQLYGSVLRDIGLLQVSKKASASKAAAFYHFLNPSVSSRILTRSIYGYVYTLLRQRGAPPEQLLEIRKEALAIKSWPKELEKTIIAHRLRDFSTYLGPTDPSMRRILGSLTIEQLADSLVSKTVLSDSAEFRKLLDGNYLASNDLSVNLINAIAPLYFTLDSELRAFGDREDAFLARLAMAGFAVRGEGSPPDATFSLRLADGRVSSYQSNGTMIPAFTDFNGLYALSEANKALSEWDLPQSWIDSRVEIPGDIPINLVSTNDITGGNSGSPLLNTNLEVVGLIFDGNLESLPNEYVFDTTSARAVSVDSRAILAALKYVYRADRLLLELGQSN